MKKMVFLLIASMTAVGLAQEPREEVDPRDAEIAKLKLQLKEEKAALAKSARKNRSLSESVMRLQSQLGDKDQIQQDANHLIYLTRISGVTAHAQTAREALELLEGQFETNEKARYFLNLGTRLLAMENLIRKGWKFQAARKMKRSKRIAIGRAWFKMVEENDKISKIIEKHQDKIDDQLLEPWKERKRLKAGPKLKEPELIED